VKNPIRIAHLLAAAAAVPVPAQACAEDVFIKFDGIEGESTHKDHKGEIEILSYSWGTSRGSSGGPMDSRGGASKTCISEFAFMKTIDKSSTALVGNSMGTSPISKARVSVTASGEGAKEYFSFELTNVLVSSYQMSGSSERPMESVSLRFNSAKMSYKPQDDKGGLGPATEVMLKAGNC
jgi:type VI secretion system secreted protein Hcp